MKVVSSIVRVINIIVLSVVLILLLSLLIEENPNPSLGFLGYFSLSGTIYILYCVLFTYGLVKYIRNRSKGWYNYFLASGVLVVGWGILQFIFYGNVIGEFMDEDSSMIDVYAQVISFINQTEQLGEDWLDSYDVEVLQLGFAVTFSYLQLIFLGWIFVLFVSGMIIGKKSILVKVSRYVLLVALIVYFVYDAVFGFVPSTTNELYLFGVDNMTPTQDLRWSEKLENWQYVLEEVPTFLSILYTKPIPIFAFVGLVIFLIYGILYPPYKKSLKERIDEYS